MSKKMSSLGLLAGIAMIGGLILWSGLGQVLTILTTASASLLLIVFLAPPEILAASEAWRRLYAHERRPPFWTTIRASWIGMAVNALLPVATVGGEVVKARALIVAGAPLNDVAATTLVDKTVQAIATLIWGLIGLVVLAHVAPDQNILFGGLIGAALLALGIGGFIAVQWFGSFSYAAERSHGLVKRLGGQASIDGAKNLDLAVRAIYRRPGSLACSLSLRLISQIWLVSEVLLTAYQIGRAHV